MPNQIDLSVVIRKLQDRLAESLTAIAFLETQLEAAHAELMGVHQLRSAEHQDPKKDSSKPI